MTPLDRVRWGGTDRLTNIENTLADVTAGGFVPPVDYKLVSDGTTVTAFDKTGLQVSSGTDGGAVLAAVLPAAASVGAHIEFRNDGNVFPWASVPALPKGITNKLLIRGNGSTVQLSVAGPRFLDFNKVADYDTFQNIEIDGFTIDVNNVGGKHHIVLGNYAAGVNATRTNMQHLRFRRLRIINAPVDPTAATIRVGIYLVSTQSAGEGTTTYVSDILVEDYRQEGGNSGLVFNGSGNAGGADLNVVVDDITVRGWYHSLLTAPTGSFSTAHIQVGSKAHGGPIGCRIEDGYGEYSGDVGIEIDQISANIVNNTIRDSWGAPFFSSQFSNPQLGAGTQVQRYENNTALFISTTTGIGFSFRAANQATPCMRGTIIGRNNQVLFQSATGAFPGSSPWALYLHDDGVAAGNQKTTFDWQGFRADLTGINYASASSVTSQAIRMDPRQTGVNTVILRDIEVSYRGASTGGGVLTLSPLVVDGTSLDLTVDGLVGDWTGFTGLATNGARLFRLAVDNATTFANSATLRRFRYASVGDQSAGTAMELNSGNITLAAGQYLNIENIDLSNAAAGMTAALGILMSAGVKPQVRMRGITWRVPPVPTTLTGLVTATGKQIGTGWPTMVSFVHGSGAAITAIDYSTNGGTTYTNILTQASAALPAGPDIVIGPLQPDDLVKVTFTTTQPTINLVPVNS